MIHGNPSGWSNEIAVEQKAAFIPADGIFRTEFIGVIFNKLRQTIIMKRDGSTHIAAPAETEYPREPAVCRSGTSTRYDIGRHSPFMPLLGQRKIVHRQEILVKRHVVVDILKTSDGREIHRPEMHLCNQSVGNGKTAVETCIVVGYAAGSHTLVWIAVLSGMGSGKSILHNRILRSAPYGFPAC